MKRISLLLSFILVLTSTLVNAQTSDDSFCEKYPLNKQCRNNVTPHNQTPESSNADQYKIFDSLGSQDLEKLLKELGYVDLSVTKDTIIFLMQSRLTMVFISPNQAGMSVVSFLPEQNDITLEILNDWNQRLRYSSAYLTKARGNEFIAFETYLTFSGGVTKRAIKTFFRHHGLYLTDFQRFIISRTRQ